MSVGDPETVMQLRQSVRKRSSDRMGTGPKHLVPVNSSHLLGPTASRLNGFIRLSIWACNRMCRFREVVGAAAENQVASASQKTSLLRIDCPVYMQ